MIQKNAFNTVCKPQTFSITARGAISVQLVGDFTHWKEKPISLARLPGDVWTVALYLPPGTYHYRFLIDGQWRDDPENTLRVPNYYSSETSVRTVRSRRSRTRIRRTAPQRNRFSQKVRVCGRNGVGVRSRD